MVISVLNYLNHNFIFKTDEDYCIHVINSLNEFIIRNFIEELTFEDAMEVFEGSPMLSAVFSNLISKKSKELKDMYHNNILVVTLLTAYCDRANVDLDDFLYGGTGKYKRILDTEEVSSLMQRIKSGDQAAVTILYEHNVGLIKKIARSYSNKYDVEYEDLFQQGSIGLLTAIEKFDYTRGYRFSTYAIWRIRQEITRYCEDTCTIIRVPANTRQLMNRVNRTVNDIYTKTGVFPESAEVAEELGIPEEKVKDLRKYSLDVTVSLEEKVGEEEDTEIGTLIADLSQDTENDTVTRITRTRLLQVLDDVLTPREKQVVLLRFSFYGREYTLEEIGKMYGVTRERIRQIEAKALFKLRQPSVKSKLQSDAENQVLSKILNIKHYFANCTYEQLKYAVSFLPENQANIVQKMFGRELKDYYVLSKKNISTFEKEIIPNIEKLIKGEMLEKEGGNLFEYFAGYKKEDIIKAVDALPEKQRLTLYHRFGRELDDFVVITTGEVKYLNEVILPTMGKLLRGEKLSDRKSIYDWFPEYPPEKVKEAIRNLPDEERNIVYRRYGKDLDEYFEGLSSKDYMNLRRVIKGHIIKLINGEDIGPKKLYITDWFPGYSMNDIKEAVKLLPTRPRTLIYKKFGNDLNESNDIEDTFDAAFVNSRARNSLAQLLKGEKLNVSMSSLSLTEIFSNYSKEQLNKALKELTDEDRRILSLKYGENYDEILSLPSEITTMVVNVRSKLKKILATVPEERKNIYELVGIKKSIVDMRIQQLDEEDTEALYTYFGYDLENPTNVMLDDSLVMMVERDIIPRLRKPTIKERLFVDKLRTTAAALHDKKMLLSFTMEEIVVGYLISKYVQDEDYDYILNLLNIKADYLKRMLTYMNKKNRDAIFFIGNTVNTYMLEDKNKSAVLA